MLNNKKKTIYIKLMFWFVEPVHKYIQQDQKAKLGYHMSMLFAYMAGGEGDRGSKGFKMFCQRGQNFFYLVCVCVCVWG